MSINHHWYVSFEKDGFRHKLPVNGVDAWNHDIEDGLPVDLILERGMVHITHKRRGNKRYVKIETLPSYQGKV